MALFTMKISSCVAVVVLSMAHSSAQLVEGKKVSNVMQCNEHEIFWVQLVKQLSLSLSPFLCSVTDSLSLSLLFLLLYSLLVYRVLLVYSVHTVNFVVIVKIWMHSFLMVMQPKHVMIMLQTNQTRDVKRNNLVLVKR